MKTQSNENMQLSDHDVLLLLLIGYGLATPYDLLSKAGLGVGQTSPSMKRLKVNGMLVDSPGSRKSRRYTVTAEGCKTLRRALANALANRQQQTLSAPFDSVPRWIILAWLRSGIEEARHVFAEARASLGPLRLKRQHSAEEHKQRVALLRSLATSKNGKVAHGPLVAAVFQWLRAEFDKELYHLQEQALDRLAGLVEELPSVPPLPI